MAKKTDSEYVARASMDAAAVAMERITDPRAKLVGVQIMTVWKLGNGKIRMIGVTRTRER